MVTRQSCGSVQGNSSSPAFVVHTKPEEPHKDEAVIGARQGPSGGKVMNENAGDPVKAWQALLPGSLTECPEKLPEINLLVPEFLTAMSLPRAEVTAACWTQANSVLVGSHMGTFLTKLLGHGRPQGVFLVYPSPISVNQEKSEVYNTFQLCPFACSFPG